MKFSLHGLLHYMSTSRIHIFKVRWSKSNSYELLSFIYMKDIFQEFFISKFPIFQVSLASKDLTSCLCHYQRKHKIQNHFRSTVLLLPMLALLHAFAFTVLSAALKYSLNALYPPSLEYPLHIIKKNISSLIIISIFKYTDQHSFPSFITHSKKAGSLRMMETISY